jgi:hypothetical protein
MHPVGGAHRAADTQDGRVPRKIGRCAKKFRPLVCPSFSRIHHVRVPRMPADHVCRAFVRATPYRRACIACKPMFMRVCAIVRA